MQTITHRLGWALAAALALLLVAALAGVVQGGPLDPPGPPGSTQPQVEPRAPISSLPFTITQPGSYFLTKNLTGSSGDGITVQADNVTIDLNGFTLSGAPGTFSGISEGPFSPARQHWTVRNGTIANWQNSAIFAQDVKNSTFEDLNIADNGFSGSEAVRAGGAITVQNVKATGNHGNGIVLGPVAQVSDCFVEVFYPNTTGIIAGDQSTIRDCNVTGAQANGSVGISAGPASNVSGCNIRLIGATGVEAAAGSTVVNCLVESINGTAEVPATGIILHGYSTASGNRVDHIGVGVCWAQCNGIWVKDGSFSQVSGNQIGDVNGYGIYLSGTYHKAFSNRGTPLAPVGLVFGCSFANNNDCGPAGSANSATSPYANLND